jgi:hypothetical protein
LASFARCSQALRETLVIVGEVPGAGLTGAEWSRVCETTGNFPKLQGT